MPDACKEAGLTYVKATAKTAASNDNGGFGSDANNTNQPGVGVTSVAAGFG